MKIKQVVDNAEKQNITRYVLEALPDWFGIPEAREEYIEDTVELAVMGVLKDYHRSGIGKELFCQAKKLAHEEGYSFMQVKTVQMGKYEDYDKTNLFYLALGFKEFEVFPTLWDEWNPCQIYVMALQ